MGDRCSRRRERSAKLHVEGQLRILVPAGSAGSRVGRKLGGRC